MERLGVERSLSFNFRTCFFFLRSAFPPTATDSSPYFSDYIAVMFKKLFTRGKTASIDASTKPSITGTGVAQTIGKPTPDPLPPSPSPAQTLRAGHLEAFKEQWEDKWEPHGQLPTPEVIEGNGGNTDWGMWTEAVKSEEDAFAPTEPMPLRPG